MTGRTPGREAGFDAACASPFAGGAAAVPSAFPLARKHGRPAPGTLQHAIRPAGPLKRAADGAPAAAAF